MLPLVSRLLAAAALAVCAWMPVASAQAPAQAPVFKPEEIEQLVAPIALYPDALVAQILMASTYPLEVVSAARWQKSNPGLKGKQLEDALQQLPWDASVKALTNFPQVLTMMDSKLDMTQKLGDAFLAQQKDVMNAVQKLRAKADQTGNLKSSKEQVVEKVQEGGNTYITIEPSDPQTVYVPTYNPSVVYGPWPYPAYPPYYYYPPGYVPGAAFFGFAAGVAITAAWHNNGHGNCDWGSGDVTVNNSNSFTSNREKNVNRGDKGQGKGGDRGQGGRGDRGQGGNKWSHNPEHRQGAGYRDQASRDRFGGGQQRPGADTREQFRGRADQGRRDIQAGGVSDRMAGGDRGGIGGGDRGGFGGGDRGEFGGGGGRPSQQPSFGGGDRGGFGGVGGGGAQTRDFSNRGSSSRASSYGGGGGARAGGGGGGARAGGGGGGARGGGGRGGGGRGGGGRR